MAKRIRKSAWAGALARSFLSIAQKALKAGGLAAAPRTKRNARRAAPAGEGDWLAGMALGAGGARRYRLFRPPGVRAGERLPMVVMLHGCDQDARGFADSTRMNRIAARERFFVLYPEQDRFANAKGCWNWFETRSGRAYSEAG
ncbi:MAG: PHB depolymerase family esterase, partial [Pseudoxanthomonas sp.]